MKFFALSTALLLLPGLHALTINTPSGVTECEPQLLEWSNGTAPYYIAILPGSTTDEDPLKSFDTTSATSLTWTVDITSGTSITLRAKDSTGTIAYSDAVTIQSGSDSSCLSSSTGVSASYGTTDSSSTATADSDSSSDTTSTADSESSSTSSASSSSTSDNAALSMNALPYASFAGVAGIIVATFF